MRDSESSGWDGWWPPRTFRAWVALAMVPCAALVLAQPEQRWKPTAFLIIAVGSLLIGGWLFFCAWSWRRVSRARNDERAYVVWRMGVLRFGLCLWVSMAVTMAAREAGGFNAESILSARMAGALLLHSITGFPLALWGGYLWGSMMYGGFGTRRQS